MVLLTSAWNQPDPCTAVDILRGKLAYGKPVRASRSLPEESPAQVVDGDPGTQWGAGADAIQWIEIDLEALHQLAEIRLLVAQWPEGQTRHLVQVQGSEAEVYRTVHEFSGQTAEGEWLIFVSSRLLQGYFSHF